MSAAAVEFSDLMKKIAGPRSFGELNTVGIYRAGRKLGLSRRQALAYWYCERSRIPTELMDQARALALEPVVSEAKDALAELERRIARLEALLVQAADADRAGGDARREGHRGSDRALD
jgi:hypothetical protein